MLSTKFKFQISNIEILAVDSNGKAVEEEDSSSAVLLKPDLDLAVSFEVNGKYFPETTATKAPWKWQEPLKEFGFATQHAEKLKLKQMKICLKLKKKYLVVKSIELASASIDLHTLATGPARYERKLYDEKEEQVVAIVKFSVSWEQILDNIAIRMNDINVYDICKHIYKIYRHNPFEKLIVMPMYKVGKVVQWSKMIPAEWSFTLLESEFSKDRLVENTNHDNEGSATETEGEEDEKDMESYKNRQRKNMVKHRKRFIVGEFRLNLNERIRVPTKEFLDSTVHFLFAIQKMLGDSQQQTKEIARLICPMLGNYHYHLPQIEVNEHIMFNDDYINDAAEILQQFNTHESLDELMNKDQEERESLLCRFILVVNNGPNFAQMSSGTYNDYGAEGEYHIGFDVPKIHNELNMRCVFQIHDMITRLCFTELLPLDYSEIPEWMIHREPNQKLIDRGFPYETKHSKQKVLLPVNDPPMKIAHQEIKSIMKTSALVNYPDVLSAGDDGNLIVKRRIPNGFINRRGSKGIDSKEDTLWMQFLSPIAQVETVTKQPTLYNHYDYLASFLKLYINEKSQWHEKKRAWKKLYNIHSNEDANQEFYSSYKLHQDRVQFYSMNIKKYWNQLLSLGK